MKKIHLISNAHIDPVWQWEWQEGVGVAITTFSAACDFCEEFDHFVFCHNESLLYEWVEKYDKPLFNRIKKLVEQGKWHIMGGWFIQPDCNMPSGESFIRHILRGIKYFEKKFPGFNKPTTAINFDSFGHTRGLVQILNDAGYDSYIVSRPSSDEDEKNMIWKGFNQSEVIVCRVNDGYNSFLGQLDKKLLPYIERNKNVPNELFLWGIGNHGGGPTRIDYQTIQEIQAKYPDIEMVHSTPEAYFADVKKYKHLLKETEDLNHVNMGCYTSQIRIKQLHRRLENELFSAEKMAAHAHMNGMDYPLDNLKQAEEDLLFNQFHDILPGTVIKSAEDTALRQLGRGIEEAEKVKLQSFFTLAKGQAKAVDGEYPIFAYNPHPYPIKTIIDCEFMLADQNRSLTDFYDVEVYYEGKLIPSQLEKEASNIPIDWRKRIVFEAELKPFSLERFSCFLKLKPVKKVKRQQRFNFSNGELTININPKSGLIDSLKIDNEEYLDGSIGFNIIENSCDPWGFFYDDYKKMLGSFRLMNKTEVEEFTDIKDGNENIKIIEDGPIRTVVQAYFIYNNSRMIVNYSLPKRGKDLKIDITLYNSEKDVKIKMHIPTKIKSKTYLGKTAFGINELLADGNEKVAQEYVMLTNEHKAIAIINFGTYGSDCLNGAINQTLINSSAYCAHPIDDRQILEDDRFNYRIDVGERQFSFVLLCGEASVVKKEVDYKSLILHQKPYIMHYYPTGYGEKPNEFIFIDNIAIQLVAFKCAEDQNGYIIRLYNTQNDKQLAKIDLKVYGLKIDLEFNGFEFKSFRINEQGIVQTNCLEE